MRETFGMISMMVGGGPTATQDSSEMDTTMAMEYTRPITPTMRASSTEGFIAEKESTLQARR